jgi:hypothetical protein
VRRWSLSTPVDGAVSPSILHISMSSDPIILQSAFLAGAVFRTKYQSANPPERELQASKEISVVGGSNIPITCLVPEQGILPFTGLLA